MSFKFNPFTGNFDDVGTPGSSGITELTGDVTAGPGSGSQAATIPNDTVTNAKLANMATQTIKGRTTAGTGDPEDLTATQATAILNNFAGDSGSGGTKGLVPAPASGDAAAGKFLKADGNWSVPSPAVAGLAVVNKTANYTLTTSDDVITADGSGGSFTLTLPTAVGNTGKVFYLKRTDLTLANPITIATTSSQTIDGSTTRKLNTIYEEWTVVSNGSNWVVLSHKTAMPLTSFTQVVRGVTSDPTKGTATTDNAYYWREGQLLCWSWVYEQTSTSGAAAGSGTYLLEIPSTSLSINTTVATASTSATAVVDLGKGYRAGHGMYGNNSAGANGEVDFQVYNTTRVSVHLTNDWWGSGNRGFTSSNSLTMSCIIKVPISGWDE